MKKGTKVLLGIAIAIVSIILVLVIVVACVLTKSMKAVDQVAQVNIEDVADGTYIGEMTATPVMVKVEVTVKDHKIDNINLIRHANGRGSSAETMLDVMLAQNTSDVDTVSGATLSSKTIKAAVNNALAQGVK